jgi:integrase
MPNTNRLKYLETYSSENTTKIARWAIKSFLNIVYDDDGELEELATRYIQEKRDVGGDIQTFFAEIKHRPPTSIRTLVSNVRVFLMENDIELPKKFWKHLARRVKGKAQTEDRIPTTEELKQILIQMPPHGTAFYLTLVSSGMRGGELLSVKLSDIKLHEDPVRIKIRGEYAKNKIRRTVFVTAEAKQYIEEWLKIRQEHLVTACARSRYPKDTEDDRLFPFHSTNILNVWHRALQKTGLDMRGPQTARFVLHPHCLRKFYHTHLATAISVDVVEALMGHEGYLTQAYRRHTIEDLARLYKEGEGALNVFSDTQRINEIKTKLEKRNDTFQEMINNLTGENINLKKNLKELRGTVSHLNIHVKILEKTLWKKLDELQKLEWASSQDLLELQIIKDHKTKKC